MTDVANVVLPSILKVHFSTHSYQDGRICEISERLRRGPRFLNK